eukprot:m.186371 g.186371  ORF g.186371 m.186371 type:complete len:61 (-) comp15590_c0_seq12:1373-1555(-)
MKCNGYTKEIMSVLVDEMVVILLVKNRLQQQTKRPTEHPTQDQSLEMPSNPSCLSTNKQI